MLGYGVVGVRVGYPTYISIQYSSGSCLVHMESPIQDTTVSSTSYSYLDVEQADTNTNPTGQIQVLNVSTTTPCDAEAMMLSLLGLI